MQSVPLSTEGGTAATSATANRSASVSSPADARQWQSYLNRGLADNAQSSTLERTGTAHPPTSTSLEASLPRFTPPRTSASPEGTRAPPLARTPIEARLAQSQSLVGRPPGWSGEILPKMAEGLSPSVPSNLEEKLQTIGNQSVAIYHGVSGMTSALRADTMIADLSTARFSSQPTVSSPSSTSVDSDASGGSSLFANTLPGADRGEFKPMRWLLPWLWQLSQRPVDEGEPIEWEVDLPEGDRLRLHAVRHYGEWILDFAGSSARLQRWLGQHAEELGERLQRIIGRPVHLYIDPLNSAQNPASA